MKYHARISSLLYVDSGKGSTKYGARAREAGARLDACRAFSHASRASTAADRRNLFPDPRMLFRFGQSHRVVTRTLGRISCSFNTTTAARPLPLLPTQLHRSRQPLRTLLDRQFYSANSLLQQATQDQTYPDHVYASIAPEATVPYAVPAPSRDFEFLPNRADSPKMVKPIQGTQYALDAQFKKISRDFRTYVHQVRTGPATCKGGQGQMPAGSAAVAGCHDRQLTHSPLDRDTVTRSRCRPKRCLT